VGHCAAPRSSPRPCRGRRGRPHDALIIVLVAIALTDRTGFLTAAITFLSVFALYYIVNYALVVR